MLSRVVIPPAISAGTQSVSTGTVVYSNSNNVTFGMTNSSIVTASASFAQSNQSAIRALGVSNTGVTAGNTGVSTGIDWVLAGSQSITLSQSTAGGGPNTIWFQHPAWLTTTPAQLSVGNSNLGNTAGDTGVFTGRVVLVGSDNITLSGSSNGGSATVSIIGAAGGGGLTNIRVSAGTTSNLLSAITFADGGGVSFGINASTLTATVATSLTNMRVSAGTTSNLLSALTFANGNGITFGLDASTLTASHNGLTSQSNQNVTAGNGGFAFQTLSFSNVNGVSFGTSAGSAITASIATSLTNIRVSAGTTSNLLSALTFANGNGITFGLDASTLTASHNGLTSQSNQNVTAANGGFAFQTLSFSDANGVSFGTSAGSAITASYTRPVVSNAIASVGSATNSGTNTSRFAADDHVHAGVFSVGLSNVGNTSGDTRVDVGRFVFAGGNGVTLSQGTAANALNTITVSVATSYRASNDAIGTNTAQTNVTWTVNSAGLSFNAAGYAGTTTAITGGASITLDSGGLRFNGTALAGTGTTFNGANISGSITQNTAGLNLSLSVAAPGAAAEQNAIHLLGANTAGNTTATGSTIGWSGINLTLSGTNNSVVNVSAPATSSLSATGAVSISVNVSTISIGAPVQTNQTVGLYALGNTTQNSSTTLDARTLSFNVLGPGVSMGYSNGSIVVSNPPYLSSYENMQPFVSNIAQTLNAASVSHAVAFEVGNYLSASFLRLPVLMTTNSTTIATTAASLSASARIFSTWNAVIYSLNTGASSRSLLSVASGSAGFTQENSISVAANGTQYSMTQAFSARALGGGTTLTTQYSISNTNYSYVTTFWQTQVSSARFLDIPFANSLSPGNYWLIFGLSTSSATNSSGVGAATNCNVRYSAHYGASQANIAFGVFGSTNLASGGQLGAGSFSTAGGGTTSALPISAISSSASNVRPYFQLLRSA